MTEIQTADEIHEQQIAHLLRDCTEEERQFLHNKFTSHRHEYLNKLVDFQRVVDEFVKKNRRNKSLKFDKLYKELSERHLTNERLDFDVVMKEYIESEYDDEDFYWVTSEDPSVQESLADMEQDPEYVKQLDEETVARLQKGDDFHVQYLKKKIAQKNEESADQDYEYDNPLKLSKQQALKVFTGRDKVPKQFKFVTSGLEKSVIKAFANATGAIGQEHLDNEFHLKFHKEVVKKATVELKKFEERRLNGEIAEEEDEEVEEQEKEEEGGAQTLADKKKKKKKNNKNTKQLFAPSYDLLMQVNLAKASPVNIRPFVLPLKHTLYNMEDVTICVIVRDGQKQAFKDFIAEQPYASNTKVLTLKKLKANYKEYEKKDLLKKSYDLFFVEKYINSMMPSILGKTFYGPSAKRPQPTTLDEMKQQISGEINGTKTHISAGARHFTVRVAKIETDAEAAVQNIFDVLKLICHHIPDGAPNVTKVLLKTAHSPSLPIYINNEIQTAPQAKTFSAEANAPVDTTDEQEVTERKVDEEIEAEKPKEEPKPAKKAPTKRKSTATEKKQPAAKKMKTK